MQIHILVNTAEEMQPERRFVPPAKYYNEYSFSNIIFRIICHILYNVHIVRNVRNVHMSVTDGTIGCRVILREKLRGKYGMKFFYMTLRSWEKICQIYLNLATYKLGVNK